jgi:hypothetical protein
MKIQNITGHLPWLPIALLCSLTVLGSKAQAQIIGDLEADIPFQFHAGNAKLPAGKYIIHVLDSTDQNVMEIRSAEGSTAALFEVHGVEASAAPAKGELIFNKYGDRYFLEKLFDPSNPSGSELYESRYEKRVSQAAAEGQERVPVRRRQPPAN